MLDDFEIGFWHPFGPYTGKTTAEVVEWKGGEILRHKWTLWSFAYSSTAARWLDELAKVSSPVYALCSHSPGAKDPDKHQGTRFATHYRWLGDTAWQVMPDRSAMNVTNPFKRKERALAFMVKRLLLVNPPTVPQFNVEWYCRADGRWRSDSLPTRGEFLVRRGGLRPLRRICAILELAHPYLAELKCDLSNGGGV